MLDYRIKNSPVKDLRFGKYIFLHGEVTSVVAVCRFSNDTYRIDG